MEKYESLQSKLNEHGSVSTDQSPVIRIKAALIKIRKLNKWILEFVYYHKLLYKEHIMNLKLYKKEFFMKMVLSQMIQMSQQIDKYIYNQYTIQINQYTCHFINYQLYMPQLSKQIQYGLVAAFAVGLGTLKVAQRPFETCIGYVLSLGSIIILLGWEKLPFNQTNSTDAEELTKDELYERRRLLKEEKKRQKQLEAQELKKQQRSPSSESPDKKSPERASSPSESEGEKKKVQETKTNQKQQQQQQQSSKVNQQQNQKSNKIQQQQQQQQNTKQQQSKEKGKQTQEKQKPQPVEDDDEGWEEVYDPRQNKKTNLLKQQQQAEAQKQAEVKAAAAAKAAEEARIAAELAAKAAEEAAQAAKQQKGSKGKNTNAKQQKEEEQEDDDGWVKVDSPNKKQKGGKKNK